jgi:hypothetical protein
MSKPIFVACVLGVLFVLMLIALPLNGFATSNNTNTIHTGANKFDCSSHANGCGGLIYCSLVTTQTGSCFDEADCPNASPFCSKATPTTQSATSAYASGFNHGLSDGRLAAHGSVNWYILQPQKGFAFHTQQFKDGYIAGFCKSEPGGGSDANQATFSCN